MHILVASPFRASLGHKLFQSFIRVRANQAFAIAKICRHTCNSIASRFFPVGVNGVFKAAISQHSAGLLFIKPNRFHNVDDHFNITNVAAADKIGFKKFIMDGIAPRLCFSPGPNFLGKTAVISMTTLAIGKAFRIHKAFHTCVLGFEIFPRPAFGWGIWVQRKMNQLNSDVVVLFELFYPVIAQITPGTHVIRKDF